MNEFKEVLVYEELSVDKKGELHKEEPFQVSMGLASNRLSVAQMGKSKFRTKMRLL